MKNRLKRVCALLLAIMMLMSTLSLNVFAGSVIPGTKDEKIHLGWKYFEYDEDNEAAGAAVQALEAGKTYCVRLAFFDNPWDENSTVTGATISVRYDAEAVNIPDTGEATVNSVFTNIREPLFQTTMETACLRLRLQPHRESEPTKESSLRLATSLRRFSKQKRLLQKMN